ncbi:MAG TPA: MBL fold metallo-hydrolase [Elusimicrobiales bacterium]|nr:MBL fold metallo-hydrolase [Elusimicrobiales bacterium]
MKLIFLGTNGWYDNRIGNTVCALVRTPEFDIVLDAGNGLHKLDKYCDGSKPVFLLLSHFHLDHISGLHTLVKFRFRKGLTICAGKGARRLLDDFVSAPFTVPLQELPYAVKVLELPSEAGILPFKLTTLPLLHADPVLGMRLELGGKVLTYCTDTGYCSNALKLAAGADLLITECAHLPGEANPAWPHFNPETAGQLALEAGARRLVLTHFSAERYPARALRAMALRRARKVFPGTAAARDGFETAI